MGISNKPQSDKKTVRERPHAIKADVQWGHGAPGAGSAIPHSGQVAGTVSAVIGKKASHFYHSRIQSIVQRYITRFRENRTG